MSEIKNIRTFLQTVTASPDNPELKTISDNFIKFYLRSTNGDPQQNFREFINVLVTKPVDIVRKLIKALPTLMPLYYSKSTANEIYRELRGIILDRHPSVRVNQLRMKPEDVAEIKAEYTESVREKMANRIEIKASTVEEKIRFFASSNDARYQFIAIMLTTGARPIEALLIGTFQTSDKPGYFIQTGIAKAREGRAHINTVERPAIVLEPNQIIQMINDARNKSDLETPDDVATYLNKINRILKREWPPFTAVDLRKIYVNYAAFKHKETKEALNVFISRTLGHNPQDLTTSMSYQTVVITP